MRISRILAAFSLAALLQLCAVASRAQQVPLDVGTTVAGYQDDFAGALNPNWVVRGANVFSVSGGMLRVASATGDPNHLLYEVAGYNSTVQEVLARIRVVSFGTGDGPRGGIATGVDPNSSQGINLHFRDETSGKHIEFLDDVRAWGTEFAFAWQLNTWYWLRLRHEPNAPSHGGVNDVFAKIWLADGTQAEPGTWQTTYDYIPARTTRTGFAGITASSLGGLAEFDVDYVLIKAAGLPNITVAPNAFVQTPVAITNQPQSQTALQCRTATFAAGASGNPAPTFQWFRNSGTGFNAIAGATSPSYALTNIALPDNGAQFRLVAQNVVSNITYSATSAVATLTVSADVTQPMLSAVQALGLSQVQVSFSEPVTAATANNVGNYQITNASGPIIISNAALDATQTNVTLTCAPMTDGATYTLVANNILDACVGNALPANSTRTFAVSTYVGQDIGTPSPPGNRVSVPGGSDISGGGTDIGGTNDQFQFAWQQRTGDFDVKVRVASLSLSDSWAEAGMMARETLASGARFVSAMATPSISGCYFQSRTAANGATTLSGTFPANYPNTWLRLRRAGNVFSGFASYDGQSWTTLGSANIAMPASIYFGFAVSSHNTNQLATAAFRDFATVTGGTSFTSPILLTEPLGQSSRRTSLVISEIMYHPAERADGRNAEFVELFNALGEPQDISGYRLSGEVEYTFPPGTILPGAGFLVVARVPADVQSIYGITGVLGPFKNTNNLANDSGTVQLRNRTGAVFLEADYSSDFPYPAAADGAGHSLVLARPSYGERIPEAWSASDSVGGSPGRLDPVTLDPLRNVLINEVLAHTNDPEKDYIELYNRGNDPVDISGCFLSDDRSTNKFTVPAGTSIPAGGFAVFHETNLNFALGSHGETVYFRNAANTRVVDAVRFGAQENGVSIGRVPNSAANFYRMAVKTPGGSNSAPHIGDIVINEIMYNPISGDSDDEYIELYNRGPNTIDLNKWRLSGGISHTFRAGTVIPPNGYLVVARNITRLLGKYPNLHGNNAVGNYDGSLANSGERIALSKPDFELATNSLGQLITNTYDIVVNEVTYRDGGRWGQWSDGGGSSLELIDARADNRLAANWADSDETAKATWTPVSVPGVLDNGTTTPDQLQVLLQGAGECLIDNVEVLTSANANLIANSTFEGGATGWTAEGTQEGSGLETTEGFGSARSYHVRATDRGDNQVNRIRTPLAAAQTPGVTNTIRARVRWLRGHPEILFRLRGNWHEAAVKMNLPQNLGTPGLPNSRALANAAPAIFDVTHSPAVPAANEPVVVTARAQDPDGIASIQLRYRIDPGATLTTANMFDDGTGGDVVAGDGFYSATIPGQAANVLVAFRVQATDGFAPNATATFPNNAPARECLVRFGETVPTGNFPSYRIWMTQATFNTWDARNNLNNTLNDVTFVLGNHRVIYNAGAVYAGSPYIAPGFNTPTGNRCGYAIDFPSDEPLLGDNGLNLDWPGGHGNENTAIQEQMAYWMADQMNLPFSHRYFIRLTVNGVTDMQRGGVFEAAIQPGTDFLEQWSPEDPEGDFFRIDRAFEFNDGGGRIADPMPQLRVYTTPDLINGGTKKDTEVYRWTWLKRSFDSANDYTNLFAMADALNTTSPEPYTSHTEALADVEQWMGIFAAEHIINNFDSWGHDIGKNMYMFFPRSGRAQLYMFDLDWLMLVSPNGPGNYTATTGPLFSGNDPTVTRMYNHPSFRRAYFRAVQAAVSNAFDQPKYEAMMDAKYASLVANGITMCDGQTLAAPTLVKGWFSARRGFLVTQMNAIASPFIVSGPSTITTSSNMVTITGTAPFAIKTIEFNGVPYSITWTTISNWTARVPVAMATTPISIVGYDRDGRFVGGASNQITVTFTGATEPALGSIVINEIMFRGAVDESEYIELFNQATNTTFDLSGWHVSGLDYTFPEGSIIGPRSFLLLARNRSVFAVRYGIAVPVFDEFSGDLQANGETISLLDANGAIIDRVRYEPSLPWPTTANGTGSSCQLIDARQENARAGNWFSSHVPPVLSGGISTPAQTNGGWRFARVTGNIGAGTAGNQMRLMIYLGTELGSALIDDVALVAGTNAEAGYNFVRNGNFESTPLLEDPALTNSWQVGTNYTNTVIASGLVHGGNGALRIAASSFGNGVPRIISQMLSPAPNPNTTNTLSFWYWATNSSTNLTARILNSAQVSITTNINITITPSNYVPPIVVRPATNYLSPGAANQARTNLPPFPPLWINEVQAENVDGIADGFEEREPWVEIFNAGTNAVSLDGLYLSSTYTNLTAWTFPPGASIGPTQFLVVFCDGEAGETTGIEYHTSFRLAPGSGSVALSRLYTNSPQVLDYVNYAVSPGRSFGSFPDGQPFDRQEFFNVTPRGTNDGRSAPLAVFINEWMAANTIALADPADDDYDDWFEIYNPSTNAVSLAGCFLTDVVTDKFKFAITTNMAHVVPARGRLLVWADNEIGQNLSGGVARPDMHVNFQLSQAGEAIALFGPDGSAVDVVTFANQTADVSGGRCPDGSLNIIPMAIPTPRLANLGCGGNNTAPVLTPIGSKVGYVGQTLSFSASASDADLPPQALSFSLDAGAPAGAVLNPNTGLFTWTPTQEQAPSTNQVTVRVRDDGVPVLDDAETMTIIVSLPPGFTSARRNGSDLELTWQTQAGESYRIEYTDSLAPAAWQPLGNDLIANGGTLSITNMMTVPQRFFRVKVVD